MMILTTTTITIITIMIIQPDIVYNIKNKQINISNVIYYTIYQCIIEHCSILYNRKNHMICKEACLLSVEFCVPKLGF